MTQTQLVVPTDVTDAAAATSALLGQTGWFEDFAVGQRIRHARQSTLGDVEASFLAKQAMNTAQAHFNETFLDGHPLGPGRLVFGLATTSTVFGLAAQDTTEHCLAELSYDQIKFRSPVRHGDTLTAYTEVIAVEDADRPDAGVVTFQHWGVRQDGVVVAEGRRRVLIKRKKHWSPS
jgi:itaconyl-CoA hydratase